MINKKSFTLVEIMIVVAIIGILAIIAIPAILRMKHNAHETAAIAALKTISIAQVGYRTSEGRYADSLSSLNNKVPSYIDSILGSGQKHGYDFTISDSDMYSYTAEAKPDKYHSSGTRSFYVEEGGAIYGGDNSGNYYNGAGGSAIE